MAWSKAFLDALASGRYAPRYRLVCLADLFGRVSRGELGSEPGTVAEGHVGLRLLADLAQRHGAVLNVTSSPGAGTTVRLRVEP